MHAFQNRRMQTISGLNNADVTKNLATVIGAVTGFDQAEGWKKVFGCDFGLIDKAHFYIHGTNFNIKTDLDPGSGVGFTAPSYPFTLLDLRRLTVTGSADFSVVIFFNQPEEYRN